MGQIRILVGDIARLHVDAIFNAANRGLLGGGELDGAIYLNPCPECVRS
jgi:O-acetyl-ADP-ribose deacetylase